MGGGGGGCCVCKHKGDDTIVLPASLSILKFYASNYSSVSTVEYQSNLQTMPTSFRVADGTGKHHYVLCFIENNLHYRLTIESRFIVLTTLSNLINLYCH